MNHIQYQRRLSLYTSLFRPSFWLSNVATTGLSIDLRRSRRRPRQFAPDSVVVRRNNLEAGPDRRPPKRRQRDFPTFSSSAAITLDRRWQYLCARRLNGSAAPVTQCEASSRADPGKPLSLGFPVTTCPVLAHVIFGRIPFMGRRAVFASVGRSEESRQRNNEEKTAD